LKTLNIVVVAPTPIAIEIVATRANSGRFRIMRNPRRHHRAGAFSGFFNRNGRNGCNGRDAS
jgi:hypothetical protein